MNLTKYNHKFAGASKIILFAFIFALISAGMQSVVADGDYGKGYKDSYSYKDKKRYSRYYRTPSITDLVVKTNGLDFLEAAVGLAGLAEALDKKGPFTLFAPTNKAFQDLADSCPAVNPSGEAGGGDVVALATALNNVGLLDDVLFYHLAKYPRSLESILKRQTVKTLAEFGAPLVTGLNDDGAFVQGEFNQAVFGDEEGPSTIVIEGLKARNGIIYPIEDVLLNLEPSAIASLCGSSSDS